uniref:Cas scaffold protein family member 4 n=1 Tax=Sphaeramia orbicularis TaxID=375764 RepID=A0A673AUM2_9TELE
MFYSNLFFCSVFQNALAKALYDNTAECADELAFRKGDIVIVMDQNVAGTSGWWMCSLYGRHGLAPANRLKLLPQTVPTAGPLNQPRDKPKLSDAQNDDSQQNIYQIPSVPRPEGNKVQLVFSTCMMDVRLCVSEVKDSCSIDNFVITQVYAVPPTLPQDPNYDIPVPSATEAQNKMISGFRTLPSPRKHEWIYDVPVSPDKQSPPQSFQEGIPSKTVCRKLYDTISLDTPSPPKLLPRIPIYDRPPTQEVTEEELVYDVPPHEEPLTRVVSDTPNDHIPLECRVDSSNAHEHTSARLYRIRNFLAYTSLRDRPGSQESFAYEDDERSRTMRLSAVESQRISTASSSSTSSCDSLPLSSSSPEPLREVTLRQDEASRRLLDLKEAVCKAVPRLMEFVSSHWRSKEHLEKHLEEIKQAAGEIACALTSFLNFALDVKGNARRLTDTNLQTRLYKQLSIVEDSGVILQQTVSALNVAGWPLNTLCQDSGQVQTPDQLERFVMVARTVPEDVKRLVSIINANGKLLFRAPQKEPEPLNTTRQPEIQKSPERTEHEGDEEDDDNDYVELQVKGETKCHSSESSGGTDEPRASSLSEHCRLYFGALQKAIGGFVGSLQDGQPPEKFISQSKLVIMVGQRLVDTLCREAQRGGSSQSLLSKSSHLCALLKQLAVATKKAALHFPDRQAVYEAQEFAKELAQRAQHFRLSLDL